MQVLREGPVRITKSTVEAAWRRRALGQRLMIGDGECRGLALVVNPTGMTWRLDYKPRGVDAATGKRFGTQSITIGNPESHSPDDARSAASRLKGLAKAGTDLAGDRRAKLAEAAMRRGQTLERLVEEYAKIVPKRTKLRGTGKISVGHANEEISHAKAAIAAMRVGSKPISEVGSSDLRTLLKADPERPNAARHRFGAISRLFDWAQDEGLIQVNPCTTIAKSL